MDVIDLAEGNLDLFLGYSMGEVCRWFGRACEVGNGQVLASREWCQRILFRRRRNELTLGIILSEFGSIFGRLLGSVYHVMI
jgi:hypothetical protein